MTTRRVGIRDAKRDLSRLVKDAQRGVETVLTDRGRPVARIARLNGDDETQVEFEARLETLGILEPRDGPVRPLPPPVGPPDAGDRILEDLLEERRRRRERDR